MKYDINLLPKKETPFVERLMYFSLHYLRYIIIITQLVVIGVFFFRFQIDQRIIDLKESVDQKKEIVQVVLPLLKEAESISQRTKESQNIINSQKKFYSMLQYYLSQFPATIMLSSLEMSSDSIKAIGTAFDAKDLQAFNSILKQEKHFGQVDLQDIKKNDQGYLFTLVIGQYK